MTDKIPDSMKAVEISEPGGPEVLRLADRPRPLRLTWDEPAAAEPGSTFHAIDLDLPPLDPGRWEIRLVLRTADRSDAVRTLEIEVVEPGS